MDDNQVEQEIQAKGKTAPRITPADIEANIVSEYYFTAADGVDGSEIDALRQASPNARHILVPFNEDNQRQKFHPLSLLTFCVLILRNGFSVTGESACASPENFDAEIGKKIARQNAVQKIWPLMGYALKQELNHD